MILNLTVNIEVEFEAEYGTDYRMETFECCCDVDFPESQLAGRIYILHISQDGKFLKLPDMNQKVLEDIEDAAWESIISDDWN